MASKSTALPALDATPSALRWRLSGMMFLQYFVQGCYLPIVSVYVQDALGFSSRAVGIFGSALAVGPLLAPFVVGQMVDRHLATQRVLALCHLLGGGVMLVLYTQVGFWPVVVLGTLYSVLYVPSMMLTNSLTFHHLRNPDREFPIIRLWGTVGFVLPAWLIELYWLRGLEGVELNEARGIAFWLAGAAGLVMGLYALSLPHTPPQQSRQRQFAPAAVIGMLRLRYFFALVLISFLIAIVHKFYFVWNSPFLKDILRSGAVTGAWEQRISSIGQISEVAVMAVVGLTVARLGFKRTLLIGLTAYLLRCLVFALAIGLELPFAGALGLASLGQALHGVCFGCFLAVAFIFVDRVAASDIRGSMQNLYGTFVLGLGFFVGGFVSGWVGDWFTTEAGQTTIRDQLGIAATDGLVAFASRDGTQLVRDWPGIWLACALLALVCVVGFALLFPHQTPAAEQRPQADDDSESKQ